MSVHTLSPEIVYTESYSTKLNLNRDTGFHPFHLHGHEFQIISRSFDVLSNDTTVNPPVVEGQVNPSRRDTITVPGGGSVTLRFRADNPGAWFFHCHVSNSSPQRQDGTSVD